MLGEVLTAIVTPFDKDGAVDYDRFRAFARHVIDSGADGLVVAATTGESPTLTDDERLEAHLELLRVLADEVAKHEPRAKVDVEVRHSYRNMRPFIEESPRVVEAALEASRRAGVEPRLAITRGGTDGAVLSALGLPTPNVFTGGQEYHSVREWASVQDMAAAAATVVELASVWAEPE